MNDLIDLPNIGRTLAKKLEAIGVSTPGELAAIGSVDAILRIGAANDSGCTNMLFALEGAIQGVRWHSLPKPVRQELKRQLELARNT